MKISMLTKAKAATPPKASRECENCGKHYFPRCKSCPHCEAANPTYYPVKAKGKAKGKPPKVKAATEAEADDGKAWTAALQMVEALGGSVDRIERTVKAAITYYEG